jgi:dTDP-glucose 4,6-dehydratase
VTRKTAVVAGGAGFIGSHLCDYLIERQYMVFAIDSLVTGHRRNIQHLIGHPQFNWIEHDIIVPLVMNVGCDEIYNLASPASPVDFDRMPDFILKTAAVGHMNLLNWARDNDARILFASTSEVYGDPLVHPQDETYLGNVDCAGPRGCYDEAKRFGEAMTRAYKQKYGVKTRVARIFNTYGPRMRPEDGRVIPNFFTQALAKKPLTIYGDGTQTRSLCFVEDLCDGIFRLMQSDVDSAVNLGNPDEYSILEIADTVAKVCDYGPAEKVFRPLPPLDPKRRRPDISKARRELGWSPVTTLGDGFAQVLAYFRSPQLAVRTPLF